eukprot:scaffold28636_cov122-Amphora_coffeaeformis.AAC.1
MELEAPTLIERELLERAQGAHQQRELLVPPKPLIAPHAPQPPCAPPPQQVSNHKPPATTTYWPAPPPT